MGAHPTTIEPAGLSERTGILHPRQGDPARSEAYLPSPCVQNHAANIAMLGNGDLATVWFGGTQEGIPDISVYFSRLAQGAERWTAPIKLSDDPTRSEQNPVLFTTPTDGLWLIWTAQVSGNQDTSLIRKRVSHDHGQTWGPIETLFEAPQGYGLFVRQPPVVLDDGAWLIPVVHCVSVPGAKWVGDRDISAVRISTDQGRSWSEHVVPGSLGCVHMNVLKLKDGLLALYRSRWADFIHASRSADGRAWSAPEPTALPNNNSSIQATVLVDGRIALVFNHSSAADASGRRTGLYDDIEDEGEARDKAGPASVATGRTAFWGAPRAPMTLAISADGGRSWPVMRDLETGDGFCMTNNSKDQLNREFSYPSITQTPDGLLQIAFTYYRRAIKHVRVPPDWASGA
ncbi:glycosyl hydrolase [Bradyrhizobium sp. CSA207]|uniref:sialidase family protein n=1 Tax=Bradyrhizobium sp. CSA207 TaxID=2698826 RepID=UPI0023AF36CF|nr:exo-alpha-sialidase [Bradyrhizobium sp. CSA207]MDE5441665.1 glycosyl hydrolase [Bradyrhizobium sp. CSA207]